MFVIPLLLPAQTEDENYQKQAVFTFNGNAGYVTVGSNTWSQIRLLPEISYGKFSLGLDFDLLVNSDMNLRRDDWNDPKDLISKIYFIKYARKGDPFYLQVDGFSSYTTGHGLIMNGYNNRLLYPEQKNVGAMLGVNLNLPEQPGVEVFTSNLVKNDILAAQASVQPFINSDNKSFSALRIGAAVATDRNQYAKYDDEDNDHVPDVLDPNPDLPNTPDNIDGDDYPNSTDLDIDGDGILDSPNVNPYVASQYPEIDSIAAGLLDNQITELHTFGEKNDISIYGAFYDIPLIESGAFTLSNYGEIAQINGYGSGWIFPGFASRFLIFNVNAELRKFGNKFLPGYFDQLYDEQRSSVVDLEDPISVPNPTLITKESSLDGINSSFGWYGKIEANIIRKIILSGSMQDMYGENAQTGKSVTINLSIDPDFLPKIRAAYIGYNQKNVKYISVDKLQTPSASIDGLVSYQISDKSIITTKYSERYVDLNTDNEIMGVDEIIKSFSLIISFTF